MGDNGLSTVAAGGLLAALFLAGIVILVQEARLRRAQAAARDWKEAAEFFRYGYVRKMLGYFDDGERR